MSIAVASPALLEGSEAIADAMVAAGCRFFSGYPMTPFTEVLEHMATKLPGRRRHLHERRERARGGRHGLGRGGHRHAERHRLDRAGALADAGVAQRARRYAADPARGAQHGARPGRLLAGHARPRPRRRPDAGPRAHGRARGRRAHAARVPPHRSSGATRSCSSATTTSRTPSTLGRRRRRVDFGTAPGRRLGARRVHQRHRPRPAACRRSAPRSATSAAATTSPSTTASARRSPRRCSPASSRSSRPASPTTPTSSWSRSARPAKYVRAAVARLRADGARVGYVRPITLLPFPREAVARRGTRREGRRRVREQPGSDGRRRPPRRRRRGAGRVHRSASASTARASASRPISTASYVRDRLQELLDERVGR